jgi:hypothetical protein
MWPKFSESAGGEGAEMKRDDQWTAELRTLLGEYDRLQRLRGLEDMRDRESTRGPLEFDSDGKATMTIDARDIAVELDAQDLALDTRADDDDEGDDADDDVGLLRFV